MLLMRFSRIKFVSAFLLIWIATAKDMAADAVRPEQINQLFAGVEFTGAPGAAVLVLDNGRIFFDGGYVVTDLRTLGIMDPHINFLLASCKMQRTPTPIMVLV